MTVFDEVADKIKADAFDTAKEMEELFVKNGITPSAKVEGDPRRAHKLIYEHFHKHPTRESRDAWKAFVPVLEQFLEASGKTERQVAEECAYKNLSTVVSWRTGHTTASREGLRNLAKALPGIQRTAEFDRVCESTNRDKKANPVHKHPMPSAPLNEEEVGKIVETQEQEPNLKETVQTVQVPAPVQLSLELSQVPQAAPVVEAPVYNEVKAVTMVQKTLQNLKVAGQVAAGNMIEALDGVGLSDTDKLNIIRDLYRK